ncbi:LysR family transcriptional regulator [Enterococcus gilvus]|uniref:LysR family transcriptional regulator n=1 Tax=Enterococcus gilvus TaxID=160453 RepID=UPI003ED89723
MTIEKLEYFYVIARYNSLTKASQELYISISSLSAALKSLENELGFDLFIRQGKKLELSKAGEKTLPYVKTILESAKEIRFPLYEKLDQFSFRVGISEPVLQSITKEQKSEIQEYNFKFIYEQPIELFKKLENKEVDLVITSSNIEDTHLEKTLLFQTEVLLSMSESMKETKLDTVTKNKLENIPFLILEDHLGHEQLTKTVVNFFNITPSFVYCHDSLGIHKWLNEGKGILITRSIEKSLLEEDSIAFSPLPDRLIVDYYLYKNTGDNFSFNVDGAKNYLKKVFGDY